MRGNRLRNLKQGAILFDGGGPLGLSLGYFIHGLELSIVTQPGSSSVMRWRTSRGRDGCATVRGRKLTEQGFARLNKMST
jgi:hypothetical protein